MRPSLQTLDSKINQSTLLDHLLSVLNFAIATVDNLDYDAPFWNEEIDVYLKYADKAVVETGLFILIVTRCDNLPQEHYQLLCNLSDKLAPLARSERNQALLMRFPQSAAAFGISHFALSSLHRADPIFDVLVRQAFESGLVESVERVPYRAMDVRWIQGLLFPSKNLSFDNLFEHSILTRPANVISLTPSDVYAITHALMYLTDFGRHPLPSCLDLDSIEKIVDRCLAANLLAENLDLLGELLICASIIRRPWSPYVRFAWSVLQTAWKELQFLPSPSFEVPLFLSLNGREKTAYTYRHTYHTMFVAGILCSSLLCHPISQENELQWKPLMQDQSNIIQEIRHSAELAQRFCSLAEGFDQTSYQARDYLTAQEALSETDPSQLLTRIVSKILSCIGIQEQANTFWSQAVQNSYLSSSELEMVLMDALLIQASRDCNLSALCDALILSARHNCVLSSTLKDTVLFLIRQQLPSGAIGTHFVNKEKASLQEILLSTREYADCLCRIANDMKQYQ